MHSTRKRSAATDSRMSRRDLIERGGASAAAMTLAVIANGGWPRFLSAQTLATASQSPGRFEDHFYRDDWLGEPWRQPAVAVLIHGAEESSTEWYGWVPRMAQAYRVIRPDLPGLGRSAVPSHFEFSHGNLAKYVVEVMDRAGVQAAHVVGAKTGGAIAMHLAADFPTRVRSLVVVGAPAATFKIENPSPIPQRDRLGSHASKEMVDYWNHLLQTAHSRPESQAFGRPNADFDLAKEGVLQRIAAPTLVLTADQSKVHSVERVRAYQQLIPKSRLVVIRSDAYHIAAANAEECVTETLAFLRELSVS